MTAAVTEDGPPGSAGHLHGTGNVKLGGLAHLVEAHISTVYKTSWLHESRRYADLAQRAGVHYREVVFDHVFPTIKRSDRPQDMLTSASPYIERSLHCAV
jgi:hypothetical protein